LDREELTGLPGTRVPHIWLERESQRISTVDLLVGRFLLLTGGGGTSWYQAAISVAASLNLNLAAYRIGPNGDLLDPEHDCTRRMGISPDGAVVIRPDGFVAWRASHFAKAPEQELRQVLNRILSRGEHNESLGRRRD
jgi:putative polyketide hydroxylase